MSGKPSESTPATNTRRLAADRRARAESSSSIESDRPDATVVRREESDSASYVRLHQRDSDPPRHTNPSPIADATLLVPQPSNPALHPLSAVGAPAPDETTLVSFSRAGGRSICRNDCRLRSARSARSARALAI